MTNTELTHDLKRQSLDWYRGNWQHHSAHRGATLTRRARLRQARRRWRRWLRGWE